MGTGKMELIVEPCTKGWSASGGLWVWGLENEPERAKLMRRRLP